MSRSLTPTRGEAGSPLVPCEAGAGAACLTVRVCMRIWLGVAQIALHASTAMYAAPEAAATPPPRVCAFPR